MKQLLNSLTDMFLDTIEGIDRAYSTITRKPKPQPSLLTYNVDWFTNCTWIEQIIAFKQLDIYHSNKH
jgi:hypothetical protein